MANVAENNGTVVYTSLIEYNVRTNLPTGRIKANIPTDPNYIAPATDLSLCSVPGTPDVPTIDIVVNIQEGFSVNIELLFGTANVSTEVSGTWTVVDRTYDGILFQLSTTPVSYIVKVVYNNGLEKHVNATGVKNIYIPGPFNQISLISVLSNEGDFDADWNDDYFN